MSKKFELTLAKETRNTFVYKPKGKSPLITSLYLMKSQMPEEAPKKVKITVELE